MTSWKLRQYLKFSFIYLLFIYLFWFCLKFRENLFFVYKFVFATRSWGPKSFLHSRPHWSTLIDEKCNLLHIKLWIIFFYQMFMRELQSRDEEKWCVQAWLSDETGKRWWCQVESPSSLSSYQSGSGPQVWPEQRSKRHEGRGDHCCVVCP